MDEWWTDCERKKPNPGGIFALASLYDIDLKFSWMVGDLPVDWETGRAAGCRVIRILPTLQECGDDRWAPDLSVAADIILKSLPEGGVR
jgi:phosphoglycolate phosphatase-like HAD superfamily hydrolase